MFTTFNGGVSWSQQQKLVASDGVSNDLFGAVYMIDNILFVGALFDDAQMGNIVISSVTRVFQ